MSICDEVRKRMSDDVDDTLPWFRRALDRFHVTVCPPCRRVHASLHETVQLLHEMRDVEPADESPDPASSAKKDA